MDEAVTLAMLVATLVFGVWLIDYAGRVRLAQVEVDQVAHELAYELAELANLPQTLTPAEWMTEAKPEAMKAATEADRRLSHVCEGGGFEGFEPTRWEGGYVVVERNCVLKGGSSLFSGASFDTAVWVECPDPGRCGV